MIRHRFTSLLLAMAALLGSVAVSAQTSGYALYGAVPSGYTDLTSSVQVVAPAVISGQNLSSTDHVAPATEGIAFTGRGHSNHYCQGSADLSIRFSENQSLTLTDQYAIHIKIKRTNAGSGDIQMSYIRNNWGSVRVGFLMAAAKLSDTESEIILKYADRTQNAGGQYYCNGENNTYGTQTYNGGNGSEIFRMTAANGESFLITGIYLEATYTDPTPGPEPEPETGEKRYYFFSSRNELPSGDDLTSVDLRVGTGTTIQWNGGMSAPSPEETTYTSIPVTASWFSFNQNLSASTDMSSLSHGGKLVIKMRSSLTGATSGNPMMIRLCNGVSYNLYGETYFDGEWHTHVFDLAEAANHPTFNASMSGTIFQFHVNNSIGTGKIDIDFAYLTNDATNVDEGTAVDSEPDPDPEPEPEQDPEGTRYYIWGGENPIDCKVEFGNGASRNSQIDDYFSIISPANWTAITFKPKADVANTIGDTWKLILRFRASMDNYVFGFNKFRVNLVNNGQNFHLNSEEWLTYGDGQWHTVVLNLSSAAGAKPANYLRAYEIAVQLHVDGNLKAGEFFDLDYIYFTNETCAPDAGSLSGRKIKLQENASNASVLSNVEGQSIAVLFDRGFVNDGGQYTLCLPFGLDAAQAQQYFPGTYTRLESSEQRGEMIHLNMVSSATIEAGVPYLYLPSQNVTAPQTIEDVTINATESTTVETEYFTMTGIYSPTALNTIGNSYVLGTDDYLYPVDPEDESSLKGFRAYFTIRDSAPSSVRARVVFGGQVATEMENVNANENANVNVNANANANANKVLRDGRMYILRGEKVYTINGQLVK